MNYRHAYHAGNFADVFKHAVLVRLIEYLKRKDAAFRIVDTHAGAGLYPLSAVEPARTGEWMLGAGRLLKSEFSGTAAALLDPYLAILREFQAGGELAAYPGSPIISRRLLRKQDRISLCELHPLDFADLRQRFAGDWQVRVMQIDGWLVPGAHLPPKENRGLVLIDPPYEQPGEFERLSAALKKGAARWPGGIFALWYPLKKMPEVEAFVADLAASGIRKLLRVESWVRGPSDQDVFRGSGLIIRNPPFVLREELEQMLPALTGALAQDENAGWRAEVVSGD